MVSNLMPHGVFMSNLNNKLIEISKIKFYDWVIQFIIEFFNNDYVQYYIYLKIVSKYWNLKVIRLRKLSDRYSLHI